MVLKYSPLMRSLKLNKLETLIGTLPRLRIYSGSKPADCAAAATGTMLCEMVLPSNWMADADTGVKVKAGTWQGAAAATGTAGYFRIYDNAGSVCHIQGTAGTSGDLFMDSASITAGQTVTITAASITAGNA